ncbi:hypothetical protein Pmani_020768 [Petrolisthes manimaculis]|uniref:ubiquitinyl hydrolase 1 n=1 Tax=Petrolisthes manimaculis TaxID=1843537 RepID=A0AAE1PFH8_9EUCA|nr:hypothetical protein Pmani_020768 [Petrolisthes manimaculis]
MSGGEDRTQHWLLTSPGPGEGVAGEEEEDEETGASICSFPTHQLHQPSTAHSPEEGVLSSPVTSLDLDRDSPLGGGLDEEEEEGGPPSIETQPPDHSDVAAITSTWISSHPGIGYPLLADEQTDVADTTGLSEMPGLEPGDFGLGPVYGPHMPSSAAFNSPTHESSVLAYGDVQDENAIGGICGLRNLGNTCFMAAGIQCLVNTPPIAQYFFSHHHNNINTTKDSLAAQFSQLTHKIWCGKYSSLRPVDFKDAFGQQWRDFRDYRQHDCQEFVTLLLETLRKQMCLKVAGRGGVSIKNVSKNRVSQSTDNCSSSSSNSSSSSRGSHRSCSSPSPSQSPHCPASPQSPHCSSSPPSLPHLLKQPLELRSDSHEESVGLDSGGASPKSSVSSSSVDAHLINLRLQPIPEEVRRINTSCDDLSLAGTTSCHDAESVTSDISDPAEVGGNTSVRRYNQLGSGDVCDSSDCDISTTCNLVPASRLLALHCDSSSYPLMEANHIQEKNLCLVSDRGGERVESSDGVCLGGSMSHVSLVKLEDIMKETKTSNVNVLVKDNPANNEILFDSEKYAKYEKSRLKNSLDNLCKSGTKRVKEVNLLHDKRSCNVTGDETVSDTEEGDERDELGINKRIRLDEKNIQYELEKYQVMGNERMADSSTSTSGGEVHVAPAPSVSSGEQRQADLTWRSFVGDAKSTVVDTFYGQFKSSLVCSACGHTSVKYDPFGTLSVPLPYANQIQICVTYVGSCGTLPTRYLITLCKVSYVSDLKAALCRLVDIPTSDNLVMAEVFDNHIARIVEDGYMTKFLNYSLRNIYAFHLAPPPPSLEEEGPQPIAESSTDKGGSSSSSSSCGADGSGGGSQWRSCNICLEEMCQTELKTHHTCEDCLLCDGCIEMSCKHHGGESLPCPVCQASLTPSDLIPVEKRKIEKPKARILRVPLVFRVDQESDNNNKRCMRLLGHPALLSLPSRLSSATLTRTLAPRIPQGATYSLLLVDGRGYNCSRCLFSSHCRGCEVVNGEEVCLQSGDTLCVRFTHLSQTHCQALAATADHPSLNDLRQNVPLTVYDCLRAFTQSETLEEADSWFCPKCERKQQATKTISVWRYPPYLIIHLERFLFHGTMSTKLDDKVIFPLDALDLSDYVACEPGSSQLYNLYACVCHMGVAQAGHYTAFARSPVTGEWHYFNDDSVTRQKPHEEEYSTAYLLFYHRQGTKFDLNLPQHFDFEESGVPKTMAGGCEEEMVGCSSSSGEGRESPSGFIDPLPFLTQGGSEGEVVEEGLGQPPVFQINKIIDNLSEDCDKDSNMEE